MVAILVLGLLGFAFILWRNYEAQVAYGPTTSGGPPGTVTYAPGAPPLAENIAITSIPVIGPLADYTVVHAENAIIQNKFLEAHSSVGPNPGQTEASAGITGFTVKQGGWSYSQVGSGLKKAVEFWNW